MIDLVERLMEVSVYDGSRCEPNESPCGQCDWCAIQEAIAALTPVLPDDVKKAVDGIRCFNSLTGKHDGGYCVWEGKGKCLKCQAADMLERLARENQRWPIFLAAQIESDLKIAESLRQRIAELEDERNAFEGSFIAATKRIAELENRNTALLMLIDKDEQHIAELKSLLSVAKCPCCNGDGAYYDGMGEVCQCQWCYEVNEALPPEQPK